MVVYSKIAMDNQEEILDALNNFEKKKGEIPPVLEQYLKKIAKTGETLFPWPRVKPLFVGKLEDAMSKFHRDLPADHLPPCPNVENPKFKEMRKRIIDSVNKFSGAPFTIQRLCELLTDPKKHYKRTDKFLRGIEKNILVVSTVDPFGNKIVSESSEIMVNGMEGSPVNGNEAGSPTTTTDLTPVQYSGFPQQQTDWTTDSWAGVGTSHEAGEGTNQESREGTNQEAEEGNSQKAGEGTSQEPRETPASQANDANPEGACPSPDHSQKEGDRMEEGEPHPDPRDQEPCESQDASPAKKSRLTDESSEKSPELSTLSNEPEKKTDNSLHTENAESPANQPTTESSEAMTFESPNVNQESEASSKAESPGHDKKSETSMESEQKDLTENSPESSQVPSQKLEEEQCDKSLPQESFSPTDSKSPEDSQDQNSLTTENLENSDSSQDSSTEKTEEGSLSLKDSSPTQSDQSPKESTEESNASPSRESNASPSRGEEEQMNVDNGVDSEKCEDKPESSAIEPKNGSEDPPISADSTKTEETAPSNKEEKEGEKTEEGSETPMEED